MSEESSSAELPHQSDLASPARLLRLKAGNANSYLSTRSKGEVLADIGYCALPLSILIGAMSLSVASIVFGHALAFLLLLFAIIIQFRLVFGQNNSVIIFCLFLLTIALLYFLYHFPSGKYTLISILNVILVILLFRNRVLPQVSYKLFCFFVLFVYLKMIINGEGVEFVALHSKNYLFIFLLFFSLSAAVERRSIGRQLPFGAIGVTAFVGFNTLGLANILTASLLLGFGVLASNGKTRLAFLMLSGLIVLIGAYFHDVRDMSLRWHLTGQLISNSEISRIAQNSLEPNSPEREASSDEREASSDEREAILSGRALMYNLNSLNRTYNNPFGDERREIWGKYFESMSIKNLILGGFSLEIQVNDSLHSSILASHQKFGALGLIFIVWVFYLYSERQFFGEVFCVFVLIFMFRSLFDSLIFIGGYFDYMLVGAVLTLPLRTGADDDITDNTG